MDRFRWCLSVVAVALGILSLFWLQALKVQPVAAQADAFDPDNQRTASADVRKVIVVGAGISGLCCALELGRAGVDVTVFDMSSVFGGHAVMSQGGVCVVDTPVHRQAGMNDSPDLAFNDFMTWGEDADAEWVRYYVDHSQQDIYEWLIQLGIRFEGVLTAPGNSVDRFHQPVGRGIGLVMPIYRECLQHDNIHFVWNQQATKLLTENDRVVGVRFRQLRDGTTKDVLSERVVLATGGFQSNLEMVREFWPQDVTFPERILAGSGRNSVGHGHKLAQQAGANLVKMDHQWNYFTGIPDPRQPNSNRGLSAANMHGIIVNPDGNRFANLHNWAKDVMPPMLKQERVTVWWIFDEASMPEFTVSGSEWASFKKVERLIINNSELVTKADSIHELAQKAGLPPKNLVSTIERYNQLVERGRDEDFHRFGPDRTDYNNTASPKIETPPFYAMQAWPLTRKSMGGVAIDRQCRVTDKRSQPIPGLYAVGELTGLAGINGKAALEGTFLGPCIITGRTAAWSILGQLPTTQAADPGGPVSTTQSCTSCHDVKSLITKQREGFWHFEQAHQMALDRKLDCLQCHAELAPYRQNNHRMDPHALTTTCAQCHVAQE